MEILLPIPTEPKKPETKPIKDCTEKPTNLPGRVSRATGGFPNEEDYFSDAEDDGDMKKIYAIPTF